MDLLLNWFTENQTLLTGYSIKLIAAIAIFFVGQFIAKVIRKIVVKLLDKRGVDTAVISFVASLTYALVFMVAIIAAISHLGFNTTSLIAIMGAAGLAIGLALQGSLSNFASGVLIISLRPFKSGDFIEVAGIAGIVEEILIFSTTLKTGDNKSVIIPNGSITSGTITNYSTKPTRRIDLIIGVSYNANLAHTKQVLNNVVAKNTLVLKDRDVTIGVSELADNSVNLVIRPWVKSENYWPVYFDLLENIKVALDEAGIEIPYPQLSLHMKKEETHDS
jgi:small conductance mechanosensitive channel